MTSTYVLFFFLAYVFGSLLLILTTGYTGFDEPEAPRREPATPREQPRRIATMEAGLLGGAGADGRLQVVLDAALLRELQRYVNEEKELAARFVAHPSPESLFRPSLRPN